MNGERSLRIAQALERAAAGSPPQARLCTTCVEVIGVSGVGITIMTTRNGGPVCVSDARTGRLEDLQFSLGEGPCQDAFKSGVPVLAPRLNDEIMLPLASVHDIGRGSGVNAVFAYPLGHDRRKVGVMTLYQDDPGDLTIAQNADSLAMAEVLTETMLSMQGAAPPGKLAPELEDAVMHRAEVHQASGMVAVQLGVVIAVALDRLRAYAYATNRPVTWVVADIVARRLRLADDRKLDTRGEG